MRPAGRLGFRGGARVWLGSAASIRHTPTCHKLNTNRQLFSAVADMGRAPEAVAGAAPLRFKIGGASNPHPAKGKIGLPVRQLNR